MKLFRGILADLLTISMDASVVPEQQVKDDESAADTEQLPGDIDPVTRNRLPPINPEELDHYGKQLLDKVAAEGRKIIGVGGPSVIRSHSPHVLEFTDALNYYLRKQAGIAPRLVELVILVTAREIDSRYEWNSVSGLTAKCAAATSSCQAWSPSS